MIQSKRSFLALGWSVLNLLAFLSISFFLAFVFVLSTRNANNNANDKGENNIQIAVTSRAMAFSALWTVILSGILGIFGTVLLGWQSPTGTYYWCCALNVHKTTPQVLGIFIGALLMFSNMTLICSVLFKEFEIRDYPNEEIEDNNKAKYAIEKSSSAFSIMCMFLTVLYAGFAGLVYYYVDDVLEENFTDAREEALRPSDDINPAAQGYIGSPRFGVTSGSETTKIQDGYVSPRNAEVNNSLLM